MVSVQTNYHGGVQRRNKMKERCVLCNRETKYNRDDPVQSRLHYIEGAGQLCSFCYRDLYNKQ